MWPRCASDASNTDGLASVNATSANSSSWVFTAWANRVDTHVMLGKSVTGCRNCSMRSSRSLLTKPKAQWHAGFQLDRRFRCTTSGAQMCGCADSAHDGSTTADVSPSLAPSSSPPVTGASATTGGTLSTTPSLADAAAHSAASALGCAWPSRRRWHSAASETG